MQISFLRDASQMPDCLVAADISLLSQPNRETIKLLAIGSRKGVTHVIHLLHVKSFAEAGAWSPFLPAPTPGELMSILTLHVPIG